MPRNVDSELSLVNEVAVAVLREKVQTLEEQVNSLKGDRDSALRWGILVLGTAVVSMGAWIVDLLTRIIPGIR